MKTNKKTVPEVMPLIIDYYSKEENGAGGSLHIVLNDGNIDDDSIIWCINYAKEKGDKDGVKLGKILLGMSKTQRRKIYNS